MLASITHGLRAAGKQPKLVVLLWAWYALLSLIPALPAHAWLSTALNASPAAATALQRFDFGLLGEISNYDQSNVAGLLMAGVMAGMIVALVSSVFVFGGILEVLGSDDERRSFMHRFYRGGGHFFWRFFRLTIAAGVCLAVSIAGVSTALGAVTSPLANSEWEPGFYLAGVGTIVVLVAVGALFLLALDYSRIRVAREDSRGMLRAYVRGLGFVLRRLFTTYGVAIPFVAILAVLVWAYLGYETISPPAGTWGAIAMLILIQQAVVFGRVFLRLALVGAERHVELMARPAPNSIASAAYVPAAAPASGAPPAGPEASPSEPARN